MIFQKVGSLVFDVPDNNEWVGGPYFLYRVIRNSKNFITPNSRGEAVKRTFDRACLIGKQQFSRVLAMDGEKQRKLNAITLQIRRQRNLSCFITFCWGYPAGKRQLQSADRHCSVFRAKQPLLFEYRSTFSNSDPRVQNALNSLASCDRSHKTHHQHGG